MATKAATTPKSRARPVLVLPDKAPAPTQPVAPKSASSGPRVDRSNMKMLGGYVNKPAVLQFKRLALDLDKMQVDLLCEGLNLLFEKHGLPPIA